MTNRKAVDLHMDSIPKRIELAGRRALVRLFRMARQLRDRPSLPLDAAGKRVLMLRQDRIGDVLVSLPVIHALKTKFPTAQIDALFGENNFFVAPHDAVFSRRYTYRKKPAAIAAMVRRLRRNRYDFLIDFMDNVSASSTLLVSAISAWCAVGIEKENAYTYDVVVPRLPQSRVHIVDRLAELLRPFGIDPEQLDLRLTYSISDESERRAQTWMEQHAPFPRIGVNISASGAAKEWGAENFSTLVGALKQQHPAVSVVLFCAPGEESLAATIADAHAVAVYPPGTFDEFAAGIKQCGALITVDTSAVHLAAAFQRPAVVLFVHDNPALTPWVPYHVPHRAVTTSMHSVKHISVDEVLRAFESLDRECSITAAVLTR